MDFEREEMETLPVKKEKECDHLSPFAIEKMFGAALFGAITGVMTWYFYNMLADDTKKQLKESVMSYMKHKMELMSGKDRE